jgi:hypothetical protein
LGFAKGSSPDLAACPGAEQYRKDSFADDRRCVFPETPAFTVAATRALHG